MAACLHAGVDPLQGAPSRWTDASLPASIPRLFAEPCSRTGGTRPLDPGVGRSALHRHAQKHSRTQARRSVDPSHRALARSSRVQPLKRDLLFISPLYTSWGSFDEAAFLAELECRLGAAGGACDALLAAAQGGPQRDPADPDEAPAALAQSRAATAALNGLWAPLFGFLKDDAADLVALPAQSVADHRLKLRPFFDRGVVLPRDGPPVDLAQRVLGHLFQRIVALGRRFLHAFLDSGLRTAWGYPTMGELFGRYEGLVSGSLIGFDVLPFAVVFGEPMNGAHTLLKAVTWSQPLRRRYAEDVDLLDDMARCAVSNPSLLTLYATSDWRSAAPVEVVEEALYQTADIIGTLLMPVLERPNPLRRRLAAKHRAARGQRLPFRDSPCLWAPDAAKMLIESLPSSRREACNGSYTQLYRFGASLTEAIFPGSVAGSQNFLLRRKALHSATSVADSCDACGKHQQGELKLMRCGRCGVARYCGVECQRASWKEHKKDCIPRNSSS